MQIEIKLDSSCKEPKVIILAEAVTEEVNALLKRLSDTYPDTIAGFKEDKLELLNLDKIIRIYSSNQKVYAQTGQGEYVVKLRLYELEERLSKNMFARISNSEIINLKKVINMDLSFSGTIYVKLSDGINTYVSRRFVSKIKKLLGI